MIIIYVDKLLQNIIKINKVLVFFNLVRNLNCSIKLWHILLKFILLIFLLLFLKFYLKLLGVHIYLPPSGDYKQIPTTGMKMGTCYSPPG